MLNSWSCELSHLATQGGWRGDSTSRRSTVSRKLQRDQTAAELAAAWQSLDAVATRVRDAQEALDALQAAVRAGADASEAARQAAEVR